MEFSLFWIDSNRKKEAFQVAPAPLPSEKDIQSICEDNLKLFFGVTFLKTEFPAGSGKNSGRIDTLGINDAGNPVIIEYKRRYSETVINQAVGYWNWLTEHKGNFELLVRDKLGRHTPIKWGNPHIICIAKEFSPNDRPLLNHMPKISIKLVRYQAYDNGFIGFESVHKSPPPKSKSKSKQPHKPIGDQGGANSLASRLDRKWYVRGKTFHAFGRFKSPKTVSVDKKGIRGEFVVLKGSVINSQHVDSYPPNLADERIAIIKKHQNQASGRVLIKHDIVFPSINWAAGFMTGRRVSAWQTVKDERDRSLGQIVRS